MQDMVKQSHATPQSICKEYLNHPLGLTLETPGLGSPILGTNWFFKTYLDLGQEDLGGLGTGGFEIRA